MDDNLMTFNGINGATGDYSLPPMNDENLAKFIRGETDSELLDELRAKSSPLGKDFPVKEGVDPNVLSQTGWGVIFPFVNDPEAVQHQAQIKEALQPLFQLRQQQVNNEKYFQIFDGPRAYRGEREGKRAETKAQFLSRFNVAYGPVDPDRGMPYYLLIVGSPNEIPYSFQFQLDVQFAVGRIHFNTIQEYANYAKSVVAVETGQVQTPRHLAFFGAESADDKATQLSSEYLIKPLLNALKQPETSAGKGEFQNWQVSSYLKEAATKAQLQQILTGKELPAVLFTASHGMEFPLGDSRQLPHQGALLCSNWPGPNRHKGKIPQDFYFAGEDITREANLLGLITFNFACFGAGCPELDEFSKQAFKERKAIAPHSFVASLPKGLLGHAGGGALATIGHVERAWGYSFLGGKNSTEQTAVFQSTLERILKGQRVGYATEYLNIRYAELATVLSSSLEELEFDPESTPPRELAALWTAHNDARDYMVIGDPAVKLALAEGQVTVSRPVIEVTTPVVSPTSSPTQPPTAETSFGFFSGSDNTSAQEKSLTTSLAEIGEKLGQVLLQAIDDLTSLEVLTYTSRDLGQAEYDYETKRLKGDATLRAMTRISIDGDVLNLVPKAGNNDSGTQLDHDLWAAHREMVALAQTNRLEFVKAVGEIASTIVKTIK